MKKKFRPRMTKLEPARPRKLELSRETVRTLDSDALSRAIGGAPGCVTTSWTSDKSPTTHR